MHYINSRILNATGQFLYDKIIKRPIGCHIIDALFKPIHENINKCHAVSNMTLCKVTN